MSAQSDHAARPVDPERGRLREARDSDAPWFRWGPYLADRQWGTVREDYSADGDAWSYLTHDQARSRAYRWGEDGLLGIADDRSQLCFALALWNERDPLLKERLFGLTGHEGNHGEDVKELYAYLDATPTASYLRAFYRYPQAAFPYAELVAGNAARTKDDPEFELVDTGVLAGGRTFDVEVEYAKAAPEDIRIRIGVTNRGPDPATVHLLPTLWFRNTWAWGDDGRHPWILPADVPVAGGPGAAGVAGAASVPADAAGAAGAPQVAGAEGASGTVLRAAHPDLGTYWLVAAEAAEVLITENESNAERLWGVPSRRHAVKDAINDAVVAGDRSRLAQAAEGGTKASLHWTWPLAPGETRAVILRLVGSAEPPAPVDDADAEALFATRREEADAFYAAVTPGEPDAERRRVQRQAFAGLIWCKQSYHYNVAQWLDGDAAGPLPPPARLEGRNADWRHVDTNEVLSMPDTWEYPWFAAWDLAFHTIPLALIDPGFAKQQLVLLTREWYMHPNGELPAYEWSFSDVNPPVHAWAAWRVYKIERRLTGRSDREFLERVFHKQLLTFTWWVNRKDLEGHNVFQGGFLGLDNIGVFDRSAPVPEGGHLGQADGTAWMGFFCLTMMAIAMELARENRVYEDLATKFLEHFLYIAAAMDNMGDSGIQLWDDDDGFFYDVLHMPDNSKIQIKVRSMVGLIPLLAVETIEPDLLDMLPGFARRLRWFFRERPDLAGLVSRWEEPGVGQVRLLALVRGHRMKQLLRRMLDPEEFLSPHGIRSLSRYHLEHPYMLDLGGMLHEVGYEPAESHSGLFGGNSNWRGPVWFPLNYLLIEALQRFHHYYGDDFLVEHPTGSGNRLTLLQIADDLSDRLVRLFLPDAAGNRPAFGGPNPFGHANGGVEPLLFHEYFDGDTGAGLGASHQTGWTALVAKLIDRAATG